MTQTGLELGPIFRTGTKFFCRTRPGTGFKVPFLLGTRTVVILKKELEADFFSLKVNNCPTLVLTLPSSVPHENPHILKIFLPSNMPSYRPFPTSLYYCRPVQNQGILLGTGHCWNSTSVGFHLHLQSATSAMKHRMPLLKFVLLCQGMEASNFFSVDDHCPERCACLWHLKSRTPKSAQVIYNNHLHFQPVTEFMRSCHD